MSAVLMDRVVPPPSPGGMWTSGRLDHHLRFQCELQPACRRGQSEEKPWGSVTVTLPAQCSVYQLRLHICMEGQEQLCHADSLPLLDPEKYTLLYYRGGEWYEAYDDCQVIRTLDIAWSNKDPQCLSAQVVLRPLEEEDTEENKKQREWLTYLIGHDLEKEASNRMGELTFTRRKLASPRRQELKMRNDLQYAVEPWVTRSPVPSDLLDWLNRDFTVFFHYMSKISFSMEFPFTATPDLLLQHFRKVMVNQKVDFESSESLVLKITGREEFLSGPHRLQDFVWVRQCLRMYQPLHLSVLPVSQLPSERVEFVDWPLVDSFSGQFSSHADLSLEGKDVDDIFMISLLDCNRKLRVKLLGFDIPELPSKCPQFVYVEATILYGNKLLSSVSSTPKVFGEEVLWNEWLDFEVLLRDLPRGAKLGLTINACDDNVSPLPKDLKVSPSKSLEQQKLKGEMLYFVNLLLIDHRSVLSQGSHTLYMWSSPDQTELQEDVAPTYQADKLSSATNPDIANSMAISFLLDRYSFPVVLPNTLSSPDILEDPPLSPSRPLSPPPSSPSSCTSRQHNSLASSRRDIFKHCRGPSVNYTSNLPQYLSKLDWMNRKVVEDVHFLLSNWDPKELDLVVALELLSMDFPDAEVRRLAVERLEFLSNDDVLKYLLQLVQTIKVEPYHDSFLARFLLRRALRSKKIGHFFFWYVRSEVAGCPFFRQRMAVILEAYLLGCGQAMLDSFSQQIQAVETLRDVSSVIKTLYKADVPSAAHDKLRELLKYSKLPTEFLVPFDPRIKAGNILLEKCKVMASKKKPLWLEFEPMDSPIPANKIGIIFKQGDDLRQDMLIIQTLVLMDSIWQEKSLDLNLIPYGCLSTGYNIGMIEIVRNASTIAFIQTSRGGKIGAFMCDALFKWLKSKCPLQEIHFKTVERFMKSCAGYCVATYVLGIGDRHNDNIMITDQGNLFHVDFGHILGHWKHFLGQKRERVPFVLTPDFLYIMGRIRGRQSLNFQRFKDICTQAYLALRSHSRLLLTLFSLMLPTGIPELSGAEDIGFLRVTLQEDQSEEEVKENFLQLINLCERQAWTVQANWWVHGMMGIKNTRGKKSTAPYLLGWGGEI